MSQGIFSDINPATTSGNQLATLLNDFKDSIASSHSGVSRPTNLTAQGMWVDTTSDPLWELKLFDGASDIILLTLNTSTGVASIPNSENQFEISKTSDDAIGPILKFRKARIAGAGQTLIDDVIGEIKIYGTTDGTVEAVQARMVTYSADNVLAGATGSYIALEACLAGTNTLQEWMRLVAGNMGVGVAAPDEKIHAAGNIKGQNVSDTAAGAKLVLDKARIAALGQVISGDALSEIESNSKDVAGTAFVGSLIKASATETHTAAARGTKISFQAIDATTNTLAEKLEISERVKSKVDVELLLAGVQYFGDPDTNGSFRTRVSGGALVHETRTAGVWVTFFVGAQPEVVQAEAALFTVEYNKYHIVSAAVTATLPAPVADGKVTIKNISGGTVLLARTGAVNIDGVAADISMSSTNESITLVTDGVAWFIV